MSYIPAIFYAIRCDRCLELHDMYDCGYFSDEIGALESAQDDDWIEVDNKHYCPCCYHEEGDEKIPYKNFPPIYRIARAACQKIGSIPQIEFENDNTVKVSSGMVGSAKLVEGVIDWMKTQYNNGFWGVYNAECVSIKNTSYYKLIVRVEYKPE